ncbi:hypothetical protein BgiMline_017361, partial [Biomphalaria glabrata]
MWCVDTDVEMSDAPANSPQPPTPEAPASSSSAESDTAAKGDNVFVFQATDLGFKRPAPFRKPFKLKTTKTLEKSMGYRMYSFRCQSAAQKKWSTEPSGKHPVDQCRVPELGDSPWCLPTRYLSGGQDMTSRPSPAVSYLDVGPEQELAESRDSPSAQVNLSEPLDSGLWSSLDHHSGQSDHSTDSGVDMTSVEMVEEP